tara:strand:+ start:279 stop:719 length:441 start_codon:yes stop_codon:yes gene_type:complete
MSAGKSLLLTTKTIMKPIKTNEQAQAKLDSEISKMKAEIAGLKDKLGIVDEAEKLEVENCPLMSRTPRQWEISQLQHACRSLKWLNNTKKAELIFPDGKYLMVPKGTKVLSPSGFHPDEKVFLKPEQGCLVDVLPRSSNMGYHDFT